MFIYCIYIKPCVVTGYVAVRGIREGNQLYSIRRVERMELRKVILKNGETTAQQDVDGDRQAKTAGALFSRQRQAGEIFQVMFCEVCQSFSVCSD